MTRAPRACVARGCTIVQFGRFDCALDHTVGPNVTLGNVGASPQRFPVCPRSHTGPKTVLGPEETSVHADGLELLAPGVGDGRLAAVGEHDRRAVGRVQGIEQGARRELRGLRELVPDVLGADHLHVGDLAAAQKRKRLGRDLGFSGGDVVVGHGTRLLSPFNASSPTPVQSRSAMLIVFTIRSGSGRARSIDKSPFFKSAPNTSMPSASTKVRWNWRAAMEIVVLLVVLLAPADHELTLLDRHVELIAREARDRERDAQTLGLAVLAGDPLDIVGRVAVGGLGDAVERTLDLVESEQERA